jgi:ribosome-associated heat shock protein Hsp15
MLPHEHRSAAGKDSHRIAQCAARPMTAEPTVAGMRLDKWLWAARFFKTRALAVDAIDKGRVQVNGQPAKRSRELHVGELVTLRQGARADIARELRVLGLSQVRGPAPVAQALYAETPASSAAREAAARARPYLADPARAIEQGRPTKRDRRALVDWQRWSASADDLEK